MAELPTGTVTVLLTDIEGSTRLWERHPAAMESALARHDALAAAIIEQHSGILLKHRGEGDSLFAVFARATDAVAAACALQQALVAEPWPPETPLRVRMALHMGEMALRAGDYYGPAVNRCARLRGIARGGQVLLSMATEAVVRESLPAGASLLDLGHVRLRDISHPQHVFQLDHPALPSDFPLHRSADALPNNLPRQLTSFVGREKEVAEIKDLLSRTPLLTLTGSGGCGKTRLALQVAADLLEEYADGVWLVELAPLADPALVPQTVAATLGVREEPNRPLLTTLSDYLRPKSLLLVVDNCEHLLTACAQLAEGLLRTCPKLQILASSREGLRIAGELTFRVPPLSLPDLQQLPPPERLQQYEAVQLFCDRARLCQPSYAVTAANAAAVAQVCRRLDGIPLAIELAAARVQALSVEQIQQRLDDMFRLLTGGSRTALPRQQTLRALIDWSYDLLSEPERTLLRRLSVFAGGWTLETAEAVCCGPGDRPRASRPRPPAGSCLEEWELLDLLTTLVEKSMVQYEAGQGGGYRLLETVRQYARDRLLASGEAGVVRGRHLAYFLARAEEAEPELQGPRQKEWLHRLETEHDNLRAALAYCLADRDDAETPVRFTGALAGFWSLQGYPTEGLEALATVLERSAAHQPTVERAKALNAAGRLAQLQGDLQAVRAYCEAALAIAKALNDRANGAAALYGLAEVARDQRDYEAARTLYEQSLVISREAGDKRGISNVLYGLGMVSLALGDYTAARDQLEDSVAIRRELGDKTGGRYHLAMCILGQGDTSRARMLLEESVRVGREFGNDQTVAWAVFGLADVAFSEGDRCAARGYLEQSLVVFRERGDRLGITGSLERFAALAVEDQPERAARLYGAAQALREALGFSLTAVQSTQFDRNVGSLRAALGQEAFTAASAVGRAMPVQQAIEHALQEGDSY